MNALMQSDMVESDGEWLDVASSAKMGIYGVEGRASSKATWEERICGLLLLLLLAESAPVTVTLRSPHSFLFQTGSGKHYVLLSIWPHGNSCDSRLPP